MCKLSEFAHAYKMLEINLKWNKIVGYHNYAAGALRT